MEQGRLVLYKDVFNAPFKYDGIRFGELPKDLQDDDVIYLPKENGETKYDFLAIKRYYPESDEQYDRRVNHERYMEEAEKKKRHLKYLELKKEFENYEP